MALEDFMDSEVGIAVAATAVVLSPQVRGFLRRGAVYGLAGLMKAGDTLGTAARGVAGEVQQAANSGAAAVQDTAAEARTTARSSKSGRANKGTAAPE
jgi:hypothetical protein